MSSVVKYRSVLGAAFSCAKSFQRNSFLVNRVQFYSYMCLNNKRSTHNSPILYFTSFSSILCDHKWEIGRKGLKSRPRSSKNGLSEAGIGIFSSASHFRSHSNKIATGAI